ncbi:hypothetical protein BB558_003310 [Smittium angustum]|uniref:UEV domain-containing protein n=1 Tax=Smittium angustum TaxID=133377 RepID=A0A2U1J6P3_SMIAN|nr:hypothetical protein BB558_003310 [Smittium angustum]
MDANLEPIINWLSQIGQKMFIKPRDGCNQIQEVLVKYRRYLLLKVDEYISEAGLKLPLLKFYGTVPVVFRNSSFNIPVSIWFPRDFPEKPPYIYVQPTEQMVIRESKVVNSSGRVKTDLSEKWETGTKNIRFISLLEEIIGIFSIEPPVYSRPPGQAKSSPQPVKNMGINIKPLTPTSEEKSKSQRSNHSTKNDISESAIQETGVDRPSEIKLSALAKELAKLNTGSPVLSDSKPMNKIKNNISSDTLMSLDPINQSKSNPEANSKKPNKETTDQQLEAEKILFNPIAGRPPIPLGFNRFNIQNETSENQKKQNSPPETQESQIKQSLHGITNSSFVQNHQVKEHHPKPTRSEQVNKPLVQKTNSANINSQKYPADESLKPQKRVNPQTQQRPVAYTPTPPPTLIDSEPIDDSEKRFLGYRVAIVDRLVDSMFEFRELHSKINHNLLRDCSELHSGATILKLEEKELDSLNTKFNNNITIMTDSLEVLRNQYDEFSKKISDLSDNTKQLDPENLFKGNSPAVEQLIKLTAEMHAIEDALYYMSKALDNGTCDLASYLKNVRKLAHQQFFSKALSIKIRKTLEMEYV